MCASSNFRAHYGREETPIERLVSVLLGKPLATSLVLRLDQLGTGVLLEASGQRSVVDAQGSAIFAATEAAAVRAVARLVATASAAALLTRNNEHTVAADRGAVALEELVEP